MKIIKQLGVSIVLSLGVTFSAQAADYQWPTNPVIGVLGASFADCSLPMNTPLMGIGYAGCSYEALEKKLSKHRELDEMGFTVQSTAQAGSRSHDVEGTGWLGYSSQLQQLNMTTFWFDGVQRLKYLVITIANDCLHSIACSENDMQAYVDNIKAAVTTATDSGVTVIINGLPEWEGLDLPAAAVAFGLTNLIGETDYRVLQNMHEMQLMALPGVHYVKVWENNFDTIDGLHPTVASQVEAADRIARVIKDIEKGKI